MANAIVAAERWLYGVLSADATLTGIVGARIYSRVVPPGAAYPLVFYTMPGAGDNRLTLEAVRVWSELIYAVRIINKTESYIGLEAGASAIEDALSRASGSTVSGTIVACVYQAPYELVEIDRDGFELRALGGLYRLFVQ